MTTIAFHDGIIAYDGRLTNDYGIAADQFDKRFSMNGHHFFCSGSTADYARCIAAIIDMQVVERPADAPSFSALMVRESEPGAVYVAEIKEGGHPMIDPCFCLPTCIGSGHQLALSAIDHGKSAIDAVRYAATRDHRTGGKIRAFDVLTMQEIEVE